MFAAKRVQGGGVLLVVLACAFAFSCEATDKDSRGTTSPVAPSLPLQLRLLSAGVGSTENISSRDLFDKLKEDGAFSYYVNDEGVKVDIEGLGIEPHEPRGVGEWQTKTVTFFVWKIMGGDGVVKLVPFLDAKNSYASKELLSVTIDGKVLCLTPKYVWTVDPEYSQTRPPGVIQDIYVVSSAETTSYSFSKVTSGTSLNVSLGGAIQAVKLDASASREVEKSFTETYKDAILGDFKTGLPEQILRRPVERQVDFAPGAAASFQVVSNESPLEFVVRDARLADRRASFKFGSDTCTDVEVGDYCITTRGRCAVQLAKLTGGQAGSAAKLLVRVYSVDDEKRAKTSVAVQFRDPKAGQQKGPVELEALQQVLGEQNPGSMSFCLRAVLTNPSDLPSTVTAIQTAFSIQQDAEVSRYLTTFKEGYVTTSLRTEGNSETESARGAAQVVNGRLVVQSEVAVHLPPKQGKTIVLAIQLPRNELPQNKELNLNKVDVTLICGRGQEIHGTLNQDSLRTPLNAASGIAPPRTVECWDGDNWKESRQNIDWVMWMDKGAGKRYRDAREDGKSIYDSLMEAQDGNNDDRKHARWTIENLGRDCVERYVRTVFPNRA